MRAEETPDYHAHLLSEIHELNINIIALTAEISRFKKWCVDIDYKIRSIEYFIKTGRKLQRTLDEPDPRSQ